MIITLDENLFLGHLGLLGELPGPNSALEAEAVQMILMLIWRP
jgi:hypothetical protein